MKAFFRYLRGELLNGFYIRKLNLLPNIIGSMSVLKEELLYGLHFQFKVDTDYFPIRHRDLKGIGQVAGMLSVRGLSGFLNGWFRLSESFVSGNRNRSERGLLNQETGELEYVRLEYDDYPSDISVLATATLPDTKRMSLIPDNTPVVGYVYGDAAEVLLDNGMMNPDFLHETPPTGYVLNPVTNKWDWPFDYQTNPPPIYAPWYGDQYMALAMGQSVTVTLSDELMLYSIAAHQKVKYNGLGLMYLFEITQEMVFNVVEDLKIELRSASGVYYYKLTFTILTANLPIDDGWGRFSAWLYLIQSKYPFIQFNESGA
jgi:hypothetical protein